MKKPIARSESSLHFTLMSLCFRVRDAVTPPRKILREAGIREGFAVLDYGCGPGSFLTPLSELVGDPGKVYAVDIQPLALRKIESIASKKRLTNIATICSDCETSLPGGSVDVVLLYDTYHTLSAPGKVLRELHRVLKQKGILSFTDHHLSEAEVLSSVTGEGLFRLFRKGRMTYSFLKDDTQARR